MNNTTSGAMAGTVSPSKLAPETIKIRNALIEKYADQPIEELNIFLQRTLEVEKDELKRLGLLAARVYILRQKVLSLKAFIRDERMNSLPIPNLALTEQILLDETAHSDIDDNSETITSGEWHSLQMIEPGEVNGVRFFKGTIINAKAEDAQKLISSGKAIVITNEGNQVDGNSADINENIDTPPDTNAGVSSDPGTINDTDDGIDSNDHDTSKHVTLEATDNDNNKDKVDALDPTDDTSEEVTAIDAAEGKTQSDNENADTPSALEVSKGDENTDNSDTIDPKDNSIEEVAAFDAIDGNTDSDNENADNITTNDPEKTKT